MDGPIDIDTRERAVVLAAMDIPIDLPVATVASRSLAWLLDMLCVALAYAITVSVLLTVAATVESITVDPGVMLAFVLLSGFVIEWFWHIAWEQLWRGQTPGKRVMGLRVVDRDGAPVGFWASVVRNLLRSIDFLPFAYTIGMFSTVLSKNCQRLGDMAAGTLVTLEPETASLHAPRRFPVGMGQDDIALVEAWFAREAQLPWETHEELALKMHRWVLRGWPDFVAPVEGRAPAEALRAAFGVTWTT